MKNAIVVLAVLVIGSFLLGILLAPRLRETVTRNISFNSFTAENPRLELGCHAVASATIYRNLEKSVEVSSGKGTDEIAIKIYPEAKYLTMMSHAALQAGTTEGARYEIINSPADGKILAVSASSSGNPMAETIILDRKNNEAIWTVSNTGLSLSGQSYFFVCN